MVGGGEGWLYISSPHPIVFFFFWLCVYSVKRLRYLGLSLYWLVCESVRAFEGGRKESRWGEAGGGGGREEGDTALPHSNCRLLFFLNMARFSFWPSHLCCRLLWFLNLWEQVSCWGRWTFRRRKQQRDDSKTSPALHAANTAHLSLSHPHLQTSWFGLHFPEFHIINYMAKNKNSRWRVFPGDKSRWCWVQSSVLICRHRKDKSWININCKHIPENLLQSCFHISFCYIFFCYHKGNNWYF